MTQDILLKLFLSVVVGGIIGAEREYRSKSAGLRTLMLICLGANLFTLFSVELGELHAPERIASNIVVGIGFVGAGVVFKGGNGVNGITTAASIWVTAALGMGIGAGHEWISLVGVVVLVAVLQIFYVAEKYIDRFNRVQQYKIVCSLQNDTLERYEDLFRQYHLRFRKSSRHKAEQTLTGIWEVEGPAGNHERLIAFLLKDPQVKRLEC